MSSLERAIAIAAHSHAGQTDKADEPYVLHALRVMLRVDTEHERIAGVLHDVVEDTPVTLEDLTAEGFAVPVVAAVEALTKRPGETRLDAARRAAREPDRARREARRQRREQRPVADPRTDREGRRAAARVRGGAEAAAGERDGMTRTRGA